MKIVFLIRFSFIFFLLFFNSAWGKERMTLQIGNTSSCISIDKQAYILRRVDQGGTIRVYPDLSDYQQIICIDQDAESPSNFQITYRYEDIPIGKQSWLDEFFISGGSLESPYMLRTAYKLGTGEGDFVEFTAKIKDMAPSGSAANAYYYVISNGIFNVKFTLAFVSKYDIIEAKPSSLNFHWYKLIERKFPDDFTDDRPIPELIYLDSKPLPDETIDIDGFNLIFDTTETVTDSDGIFEIYAFVDPKSFTSTKSVKTYARSLEEKQAAAQTGIFSLKYKKLSRQKRITGHYCEVIEVQGKVTIVEGDGANIKVGDILYPGTKLSLSSQWGAKALLGLRFINGRDALVTQDVYTNACITDLIKIGDDSIENLSVIQGKTNLMSVTRWLCEEIAGLPNTPEKWAKATGKLAIKTAAGLAVPGSGLTAFAIRYVVKRKVGAGYSKVFDTILTSGGNNRKREFTLETSAQGDARVAIGSYYDGSMRIAENMTDDDISLYTYGSDSPFLLTQNGEWTEIIGNDELGRTFYETPDSIDKEAPEFKITYEFNPDLLTNRFYISANDFSGIDLNSFSVLNNGDQITSLFEYHEFNKWSTEFLSASPLSSDVNFTVSDKIGNTATIIWNRTKMPAKPKNLQVSPGYIYGGSSSIRWEKPDNIEEKDIKFYEIRQKWTSLLQGGWTEKPWLSVGTFKYAKLKYPDFSVPKSLNSSIKYAIEVRACNLEGICGDIVQSKELKPLLSNINLVPIYNLLLL